MRSNIHTSRHLSYLLTYGTLNHSDFVRGMNNKVQRCAKQPPHRNLFACVGSLPPHVFGQTCFRDNVEDEWLIVYILFKLSERFEDLVIRQVLQYLSMACARLMQSTVVFLTQMESFSSLRLPTCYQSG